MTDTPNPVPAPQTRVLRPTRTADATILLIAAAACVLAAGALLFLGFRAWGAGSEVRVIDALKWIGLGALAILAVALLIQLAGTVGSRVEAQFGAGGVSLDIDTEDN